MAKFRRYCVSLTLSLALPVWADNAALILERGNGPEPATLDLESLVEQLQKSPELASALAALIAAQAPAK